MLALFQNFECHAHETAQKRKTFFCNGSEIQILQPITGKENQVVKTEVYSTPQPIKYISCG
jgi:hypothetical protein